MITIQFYLQGESTHIFALYEMTSNPFKTGDIIHLSVSPMPAPNKLSRAESDLITQNMIKNHDKKRVRFDQKRIKLIKEQKYINIESDSFSIEYECVLI